LRNAYLSEAVAVICCPEICVAVLVAVESVLNASNTRSNGEILTRSGKIRFLSAILFISYYMSLLYGDGSTWRGMLRVNLVVMGVLVYSYLSM